MTVVAMTIAGSDSGGGAGIQADLKTFQELDVYGTSALTAITVQNTTGVYGVYPIEAKGVYEQIVKVFDDFDVKAVKTGMLFSADIIEEVTRAWESHKSRPALVVDPVMIAKGGSPLLREEAIQALKERLIPLATIVTPNIPEAEVLTNMKISSNRDIVEAAHRIVKLGAKAVVMKGGHRVNVKYAEDYFLSADGEDFSLQSPWVNTKHTHGTGCTFSAAITASLAQGKSLSDSVIDAKHFIQAALTDELRLGAGNGPTNHWAYKRGGQAIGKDVELLD